MTKIDLNFSYNNNKIRLNAFEMASRNVRVVHLEVLCALGVYHQCIYEYLVY